MKVTFPHMGNSYIAIKALLKGLKLEVVVPPPISNKTYELGVKNSPEFACLPLKLNMGNFIEALDQGADTIVMAGGWGPCRFGYYAQVERDILRDLGYDFDIYILESPDSKLTELILQLKDLGQNVSLAEALKALRFAWIKLKAVEQMEKKLEYYLPRSLDKDKTEKIYEKSLKDIDDANNKREINQILKSSIKQIESIECTNDKILKVGLIGEIYTILEPASNVNIVKTLGRLGVEITRSTYLTDWINDHILGGYIKKSNHKNIIKCAKPYVNYWVGGHGRETIGYAVHFAKQKYDGLIQIGPLTCMPEIVAQSILGKVGEEKEIPHMTIYFDEQSGSAGINTRLEAFVDMIQRNDSFVLKEDAKSEILSWS
ncbi:Activator of (R)-2-hydroxyglutaryl-CoA dehydratase [Candidatus Syntrophocurvum alkaliphilum]|uniref:Activator of (R)-2-hydroxyglutaryl-CoA dehydratase n=1 Tax=Candidatus Syntrophocurvum alkaliphilum TaxID=2293317 RepID=A0A6I6DC45_9FIRM|nr:acyl-CoA dehydratase activase-related protein [Candidatus Syntrophocurvum alkaliphilum]QGT99004.1 Activator of (R)-2-hydroxyglutaryl-CoA dehydratase [Candidatus Syntrophocurvum alkaliphilum]